MKILHTADVHLGDLNGPVKDGVNIRRQDTIACMKRIVPDAWIESRDVTTIVGDLFNRSRVWAGTALEDVNDAIRELLRPLCEHSGHVVALFGTDNHDNPRAFEVLKQATTDLTNLHIYTEPGVHILDTSNGPIQIAALPGFDRGRLRLFCPGADKETENRNATALVNDVLLGLGAQVDRDIPSVLAAHYTVAGSEADNGSVFMAGQDVVLLPDTIDLAGFTLACLGHIHRPQRLVCHTPAYYSGSPNQLTFNDEGVMHGFYLHEITTDNDNPHVASTFVRTPEREHFTLRMSPGDINAFVTNGTLDNHPTGIVDAVVRVRYSCASDVDKSLNKAEMQKKLLAAGAFHVAEILREDDQDTAPEQNLTEHDGPTEALERYLSVLNIPLPDIKRLMELASPLIRKADDGRDAGRHTGMFSPIRVEVTNYRCYSEATFEFGDIRMVMVGGQNGVGKSSLFMDAITDCLFEQSRDEVIGGWVRDGCKNGSVTFEFSMGIDIYRVIRTRMKTGRGTLALHRFNTDTGVWEDESDTSMKLTQERIERVLGMDFNTFCSVALIRQDAYGLFLEAKSDQRMEVLSAILGLDVYSRLEEYAKVEVAERKRVIAAAHDRLSVLNEQIGRKVELEYNRKALKQRSDEVSNNIAKLDTAIESAQRKDVMREEHIKQVESKTLEAAAVEKEAVNKSSQAQITRERLLVAEAIADCFSDAESAVMAIEMSRASLERLAPYEEQIRSLTQEDSVLYGESIKLANIIQALSFECEQHNAILDRRAEIEDAEIRTDALKADRDVVEHLLAEHRLLEAEANRLKSVRDSLLSDSRVRIKDMTAKVEMAARQVDSLKESGCPVLENATCIFLIDATVARDNLPIFIENLEKMKADDRYAYEQADTAYKQAQAAVDAIGNPHEDLSRITSEERKLASLTALSSKLHIAVAKCESLNMQLNTANTRVNEIVSIRSGISDKLTSLKEYAVQADSDRQNIKMLEDTASMLPRCNAAKATIEALRPQVLSLEHEAEGLNLKCAQLMREASDMRGRIPSKDSVLETLKIQRTGLLNDAQDISSRRGSVETLLKGIEDAEARAAEYRAVIIDSGVLLNDYLTLAQAFGLDGVQYMIIRGVVPEMMGLANDILAAMTGGRMAVDIRTEKEQKSTQKIVNSLEVWITSITGGSRPYSSHSGGEMVKIALAVTLALADVKARRAGVQLGMLFIDEPPYLDGEGTEAYADALSNMAARNPDMRILAISHDPMMKARFPQNIIVSATDNGSSFHMER